MVKKLLVLGGSENQVPIILAAKREGYRVVLCDFTDWHPGIRLSDVHYRANTLDFEAVLEVARREHVDGVISNSEPAMLNVARVSKELGLIGNPPEAIETLGSKSSFRDAQAEAGLFCPVHYESSTFEGIYSATERMSYPLVVKPVRSSATRGTTVLNHEDESLLRAAFDECKEFSSDGAVSVEEYVKMPSLDVVEGEVFVVNGEFLWEGLMKTVRSPELPMVPMTYCLPLRLDPGKLEVVKLSVRKLFRKLGIRHGEYNVEAYFTSDEELFVIEINPRQGGKGLPKFVERHSGIDYSRLLVTTAVGDLEYWADIRSGRAQQMTFCAQHLVFPHTSGVFEGLQIDASVERYVENIDLEVSFGQHVERAKNAAGDEIARILLVFPGEEELAAFSTEPEKYISCSVGERSS